MSDSKHSVCFPGESESYRTARDKLLDAEIELRRNIEAVAAKRRELHWAEELSRITFLSRLQGIQLRKRRL